MGCGISKPVMMNADAIKSQPGLLPIRRRIEEIRRAKLRSLVRRSKSQLSTRDLLDQDDDHLTELESLQDDGRTLEVQEIPVMEKMKRDDNDIVENKETTPVVVEKMKRNESVQNKEINPVVVEEMKRNDSVQNKEISPVVVEKLDDNQKHQEEDNVVEVEDEELGNRLGEGPGSPSFREYCTFPSSDEEDDKEAECKIEEEIRRESTDSSEGSVDELVHKKERKGRRFRRVLPKGGQAVVKNLLNVTGCYCSNPLHHTNTRPLEPVPTS